MQYIASISYGKDSLAMLEAIKILGLPLDRIVTAEVWATDTIQADLPPMVEFKDKADKIIKERYGIEVEHFRANRVKKVNFPTYQSVFYRTKDKGKYIGDIFGFPPFNARWCQDLKLNAVNEAKRSCKNSVFYLGIAVDEQIRIKEDKKKQYPLVDIGWTEADCRKWCEENDLLSPIYTDSARGGCWFCHNQGVGQLRLLRKNYPDLWALLLKWDNDSPVTFHADGHTVHDFDERFALEDAGLVYADDRFRWSMLTDSLNYRLF